MKKVKCMFCSKELVEVDDDYEAEYTCTVDEGHPMPINPVLCKKCEEILDKFCEAKHPMF